MKALVYTGEKNLIYQDYSDPIKNRDEEIIKISLISDSLNTLIFLFTRFPPLFFYVKCKFNNSIV